MSKRPRKQRRTPAAQPEPQITTAAPPTAGRRERFNRTDVLIVLGAILVSFLVYANAVSGQFVYDDTKQIVGNQLIQDGRFFGKALVSDVWAFKGDAGQAWSNYWRPTFVVWLIVNNALLGVGSAAGWHITNLLLHALVIFLAYGMLRQLRLSRAIAGVIVFIFAVHPVHVESVAWISGSPDLLMSAALLGALWLVLSALVRPDRRKMAGAAVLFVVALLAKEVAIVFPAVIFVAAAGAAAGGASNWQARTVRGIRVALPFIVIAVVYFVVRSLVLGQVAKTDATTEPLSAVILSAPSLLAFYLRQSLFPLSIGPSYPLRAVHADVLTLANFWAPLLVVIVAAVLIAWAARQGPVQQIGAALFILPLLPTLNINAFAAEQLVHDRYLYLPLLGFLMIVVPSIVSLVQWLIHRDAPWTRLAGYGVAVVCCLLLGAQTVRYNTAWLDEVSLWAWAVKIDPTSQFNWAQYGNALTAADRPAEARAALDKSLVSLDASSTPNALINRAQIAIDEGRFDDAEADLNTVLAGQPENIQAYEQLAVAYQAAGRLNDAANILVAGRERVPYNYCSFTNNLAVIFYLGGAKDRALQELESIRSQAVDQPDPGCRAGVFHLGQLYLEQGRTLDGRAALEEYLALTRTMADDETQQFRASAQGLLSQ
ncbi:MAG: tetratricopeptide repeat protein [Caldilineae bacterium]|nr:tetratricopeptide repeat protein [Caldilineae bacterium]